MPGMYPRIVSRTLIQNCLPIPTCKNTPRGGRSIAIMIRSRSIEILLISILLTFLFTLPPYACSCSAPRTESSCSPRSTSLRTCTAPLPSSLLLPVVRFLWCAVSVSGAVSASAAALLLYPGETVAQPKKKENDCGDEDDEH